MYASHIPLWMGRSWGYSALTGSPRHFAGLDHKVLWCLAQCICLESPWDIFGWKIIWEKLGEFLLFWCRKKNSNNPHNFRLWRFCFSSSPVMGVSCEERNGVYLRCEAVNDRTKVRCVLKRLGIDFLKMFFPGCSYQGAETSLYTLDMFWSKVSEKDMSVSLLISYAEMIILSTLSYFTEKRLCWSLAQWFCMDFTPYLR